MKPRYDDRLLRKWWKRNFDIDYDHVSESIRLRMSKTLSFQVYCLGDALDEFKMALEIMIFPRNTKRK